VPAVRVLLVPKHISSGIKECKLLEIRSNIDMLQITVIHENIMFHLVDFPSDEQKSMVFSGGGVWRKLPMI